MIPTTIEGSRDQKLAAYRDVCDQLVAAYPPAVRQGGGGSGLALVPPDAAQLGVTPASQTAGTRILGPSNQ